MPWRSVAALAALVATSLFVGVACGARSDLRGAFVEHEGGAEGGPAQPVADARADVVSRDGSSDAPPPKPDGATEPPLCREALDASAGEYCTLEIGVASLKKSMATCFVDVPFEVGSRGVVVYPCDGEGAAMVTFGDRELRGASRNGLVDVCYSTTFDWSDGCTWTSVQRITGSVAVGRLAFTYGESASGTRCQTPCTATGEIEVL